MGATRLADRQGEPPSRRRARLRGALAGVTAALVMAAGSLGAATPAAAVANRTVGFWSMDERGGSTLLLDSSGNRRHGTIGADVTTGALFEGATAHRYPTVLPAEETEYPGHVDRVPHSPELNPDAGDYSFEIRFRTTYAFGNIVQKGQGGTRGGYFKLQAPGGTPGCLFRGGDGASRTGYSNTPVDDGRWHTIRCVRTPTYVEMYVDGVRTSRANGPTGTISNTWELAVGGKGTCDGTTVTCDYFVGDIDYLRIEKGTTTTANAAPSAALEASCTGLVCALDASGSTDADGAIQRHAWDFGDGAGLDTASVPRVSHTFAEAGTYPVRLTVTDDRGASSTTTRSLTVAPVAETVSFVGAATADARSGAHSVVVPAGVQPGDVLLAFLSQNTTAARTAPAGWSLVRTVSGGFGTTTLYRRTAGTGDAGTTATWRLSATSKANLALVAYRGVDGDDPLSALATASSPTSSAQRTTPAADVATGAAWALSYWMHGDATTTALTSPAGVAVRARGTQDGTGHVTTLLADSGASLPQGPYGGLTATAAAPSTTATTWTLVLRPAGDTPPPPPAQTLAFVGESTSNVSSRAHRVAVPAPVAPGDVLVLALTTGTLATAATPAGWAQLATADGGGARSTLWTRTATAADAGSSVGFTFGTSTKANLVLAAYRGADPAHPVLVHAVTGTTASSAARTTPVVTVPSSGGWALSYWAHRDSTTTTLAPPPGVTVRSNGSQTGGGRVTGLLADSARPLSPGPYGALTATAAAPSTSAITWTLVLTPAPTP